MEVMHPDEIIMDKIYLIRGLKVMLDNDLASLYGVETRILKQAVRRNLKRFPEDFMFELTMEENNSLRSQTGSLRRGAHTKYLPFAFTEQGVAMLSSVLYSDTESITYLLSHQQSRCHRIPVQKEQVHRFLAARGFEHLLYLFCQ
jgi:hypothetical protein